MKNDKPAATQDTESPLVAFLGILLLLMSMGYFWWTSDRDQTALDIQGDGMPAEEVFDPSGSDETGPDKTNPTQAMSEQSPSDGSQLLRGSVINPPLEAPGIELSDHEGQAYSVLDREQPIALVFFGFTHCPDVCPFTLSKLEASLREYDALAKAKATGLPQSDAAIRIVFVSVDPERDTHEQMSRYISSFDMPVTGLTGSTSDIEAIAADFGVAFFKEYLGEDKENYSVTHSGRVFVINEDNQIVETYIDPFDPSDLAADLVFLLSGVR